MHEPFANLVSRRQTIKLLSAGAISSFTLACRSETKTASPKTYLRFVVASDGHYGEPGTPWKQNFADLVTALSKEHETSELDFVVINGDIVHRTATELLPEAKRYFDQLPFPYFVTRGNHDSVTDKEWQATWGYPPNHVVFQNNATLLLIDTSDETGGVLCGDQTWAESMIQDFDERLPAFAFMHIPYLRLTPAQECSEMANVIARYKKIRAIFHGHDHSKDAGILLGQQAILFDGHFGSSWGTPYRGYRVVEQIAASKFLTYQYDYNNRLRINELNF